MTDPVEPINPPIPPTMADQLRNFDVSQFSTISRMKPTTANLPPNSSQKEHLKRYSAESHILLHIAGLWMSNQIKRLVYSVHSVPTLMMYLEKTRGEETAGKVYDMFELAQLRHLLDKSKIHLDLLHFDPKLFGIPISIHSDQPSGMIRALSHSNEPIEISPQTVEDADSIFNRGDVSECFLFAFFYLLDQRVLLEGQRERGQIIPRFLRIYASHTMNQILFTYFDSFILAYRECVLIQGIEEDKITLGMLAAMMAGK